MTTRVEFLEKVFGPGPGLRDAVYTRSGRRYRVGEVADFDDTAFEIIQRDIPQSAYRVVGEDVGIRARKAETVQENQARALSEMDMDGSKTEAKHLRRKMEQSEQEMIGIDEPVSRETGKKIDRRTIKGKLDIKSLRSEIIGE